jgi:hypothetical protein
VLALVVLWACDTLYSGTLRGHAVVTLCRTQDEDSAAYLVRSVDNKFAGISRLSADYLTPTGIISKGPKVCSKIISKDISKDPI